MRIGIYRCLLYHNAISIASIRLTAAGLNIPQVSLASEPELALYNYLQIDRR